MSNIKQIVNKAQYYVYLVHKNEFQIREERLLFQARKIPNEIINCSTWKLKNFQVEKQNPLSTQCFRKTILFD